uniref:Rep(PMBA19a) n=1 Tax=Rhizobium meliloti TaxID=382 RepID=Q5BTP1_RHIML|nr:Rep(pMBA19a) [Sinorhizobium meliloti]
MASFEHDLKQIGGALGESLQKLHENIQRTKASKADEPPAGPAPSMRPPPDGDAQPDLFVPALYDVATKDSRSIMDVAVFRLSKKEKRAGDAIRYELPDGYVEVAAGHYGMASVWDYDIILMMISHFTEAMNRHREGRGPLPGRQFRPYISEILKFCRRSDGGRQYQEVEAALDRLKTTTLKVVRTEKGRNGRTLRKATAEGLIDNYEVVSYADNGHVLSVMIHAPEWLYREITEGRNPNVLTVHPDYFLIDAGIGRFIYRLARRSAGKTRSKWSYRLLYERSGSTGTLKKFTENLRKLVTANDLPEYTLQEEPGQDGPLLVMENREVAPDGP